MKMQEGMTERWFEIFDDQSFDALLDDPRAHTQPTNLVYHVMFRDEDAPSPNTAPVYAATSLVSSTSSNRAYQAITDMFPPPENAIDPFTQTAINELDVGDRVLLHQRGQRPEDAVSLLLSASSLFEWVKSQLSVDTPIFYITLTGLVDIDGVRLTPLRMTAPIWSQLVSHAYCPLADAFRDVYIKRNLIQESYNDELTNLRTDGTLYSRIQYLIYDLIHFENGEQRLYYGFGMGGDERYHHIYLSLYYFSPTEQMYLATFPTASGKTLIDLVIETVAHKFTVESSSASSTSAHVCSSHDIAPIYRRVFQLEHKFYSTPQFKSELKHFIKNRDKEIARLEAEREQMIQSNAKAAQTADVSVAKWDASDVDEKAQQLLVSLDASLSALQLEINPSDKTQRKIAELTKQKARLIKKKF